VNGLPSDFDPEVFVGRLLELVSFSENTIVLVFADALTVSISGTVAYQRSPDAPVERERAAAPLKRARERATAPVKREQAPALRTGLIDAVGRVVEAAELKSPRELILRLEGDFSVTLLDDCDHYECYQIELKDRLVVV
jgi:hypothetical protein